MVDTNQITYKAPVEGYFTQLDLAEGQEVKKGDLLYIVDSGGGSAELLELNSQISDAKSDYDSTVAGYEEQIKDLRAEIEDYRSGRKKQQVATPGDADPADDTTDTTTDDGDEEDGDYDIPIQMIIMAIHYTWLSSLPARLRLQNTMKSWQRSIIIRL